jgi:hypothetical protein
MGNKVPENMVAAEGRLELLTNLPTSSSSQKKKKKRTRDGRTA